jgi:MATE family multidrug resistance protein
MRASLVAMVLNVILNWVLIDGHLGAPALGVAGAALASTLSSTIAFLGLAAAFVREGRHAGARGALRVRELGRLLRFGVPSGFNWFLEFLAFVFFINVIVAGLGTVTVAAFMSVLQINMVAFMPSFAVASAGAILVGQAIGRGEQDLVPRTVGVTFAVCASWQMAAGLAYLVAPRLLLEPFARDGASAAAFLDAGARMLLLSAAWQLFDAAATAFAEALRAAGDTLFVLLARVAIAWAVFAPGSWVSVRVLGGGDVAAVGWMALYVALLAGVLWLRFRSGAWRRIVLVEPGPA